MQTIALVPHQSVYFFALFLEIARSETQDD